MGGLLGGSGSGSGSGSGMAMLTLKRNYHHVVSLIVIKLVMGLNV